MTGYQLLLLVLTLAAVILGVVAVITRDVRWLAAAVTCVAGYLLVQVLNSL
jgi:hypothetical protein